MAHQLFRHTMTMSRPWCTTWTQATVVARAPLRAERALASSGRSNGETRPEDAAAHGACGRKVP
eukprot:3682414-Lingulodinium_polyedra.AAC.1